MLRFLLVLAVAAVPLPLQAIDSQNTQVSFKQNSGSLQVIVGEQPVAEYDFNDELVLRPYFRHVRTLTGQQVTRNSPPIKPDDLDDHATMHPGLWLAFGDLSGADFWRNKGRVKHVSFAKSPQAGAGRGSFAVRNSYEAGGRSICSEDCSITVVVRPEGYRLDWASVFRSERDDFSFGDQEEMGLGVRVATPLAVVKGGEIADSQGRKNGEQVWGQQANWCQYGGILGGRQVGVVLMPHPENFRRSWFHARDYGLLVANPFGQNAFTKGEKSSVVVPKGETFFLRFGVLIYSTLDNTPLQIDSAYKDYLQTE
jgi:hypothetical protein